MVQKKEVSNRNDHTLIIKDKDKLLTKEQTEVLEKLYADGLFSLTSPCHREIKITGKKTA
jgi:hypothetical protein